ncbi:myb dna- containing [Fusarium sporotrichioides]|uniref:Myb dna-containing n=1 Tax=Fusarium sporotrichioides TaxID=5514 RepID=A0A395S721_FUSSP|nr:myb dna- containing [Fusarium sporotrichioides]
MATIEPRLIHLLNEPTKSQINHTDLPPLHSLSFTTTTDRSLPPLEPLDTNYRGDRPGPDTQSVASAGGSIQISSDDGAFDHRKEGTGQDGRLAPASGAFPFRTVTGDSEVTEFTNSISRILDDDPEVIDDASNKKRHRSIHVKDDFVQLPQPLKKQKATQQAPVMPPIINGLHEPPPHAALFPPISSESFNSNDGSQMKVLPEILPEFTQPSQEIDTDLTTNKARKRTAKPRRKWSEEETSHLLLGVNRHGVGKWTSILEDTDFTFNGRTAGDLKDRFRTCCPDELRKSNRSLDTEMPPWSGQDAPPKSKTDVHLERILIDGDAAFAKDATLTPQQDIDTSPKKKKKSRAHRKKMEDLVELGIHGPFKKSHRRERRPFTEQDDTEILEGLDIHGPAWTKIQRDPRFHLSSRQPTDLRDRVRNKYADVYQRIEKGTFQTKETARGNGLMEPSVSMSIESSFKVAKGTTLEPQTNSLASREDLPRWPVHQRTDVSESVGTAQVFEFGEAAVPFMGGEMDISRLLLDDAKLLPATSRFGIDGVPSFSPHANAPQKGHVKGEMQQSRK